MALRLWLDTECNHGTLHARHTVNVNVKLDPTGNRYTTGTGAGTGHK